MAPRTIDILYWINCNPFGIRAGFANENTKYHFGFSCSPNSLYTVSLLVRLGVVALTSYLYVLCLMCNLSL